MSEVRVPRKIADGSDVAAIERELHKLESQLRHDTFGSLHGVDRDNDPDLVVTITRMAYLGEE